MSDPDAQITSTVASSQTASETRRKRFEDEAEKRRIDEIVGWTSSQSRLVDSLVCLAVKLATHCYPTLSASETLSRKHSSKDLGNQQITDQTSANQPDSSSNCGSSAAHVESIADALGRSAASSVWYECVSNTLLDLLHHDHQKVDESQTWTCCLGAITIVSRVAVHCPLAVFKSREFRVAVATQICRAWKLAQVADHRNNLFDDHSKQSSDSVLQTNDPCSQCLAAFRGLHKRRTCLAAIELLINHPEAPVSTYFIRTLVPQVFRWLQGLSLVQETSILQSGSDTMVSRENFENTLHAAVDILESLLDIASQENRQGLLLIIVPLLCSLLSQNLPTNALIYRWLAATSVAVNSEELRCGLHLIALKHLISMAPRFHEEFRSVLNALGDLKPKLESAIKHFRFSGQSSTERGTHSITGNAARQSDRPVIQLKTDFSNFAKG